MTNKEQKDTTMDIPVEVMTKEHTISGAAKVLDKYIPGWYNRIDVDKLRMHSPDDCILGQLFGGFIESPIWKHYRNYEGVKHIWRCFAGDACTRTWKRQISNRKAANKLKTVVITNKDNDFEYSVTQEELDAYQKIVGFFGHGVKLYKKEVVLKELV